MMRMMMYVLALGHCPEISPVLTKPVKQKGMLRLTPVPSYRLPVIIAVVTLVSLPASLLPPRSLCPERQHRKLNQLVEAAIHMQ